MDEGVSSIRGSVPLMASPCGPVSPGDPAGASRGLFRGQLKPGPRPPSQVSHRLSPFSCGEHPALVVKSYKALGPDCCHPLLCHLLWVLALCPPSWRIQTGVFFPVSGCPAWPQRARSSCPKTLLLRMCRSGRCCPDCWPSLPCPLLHAASPLGLLAAPPQRMSPACAAPYLSLNVL